MTCPPAFRTGPRIAVAVCLLLTPAVLLAPAPFGPAEAGEGSVEPNLPVFVPTQIPTSPPVFVPPLPFDPAAPVRPTTQTADSEAEAQVARATAAFLEARTLCARLSAAEYSIDCLSDQLTKYAEALPATGEFAEARRIVATTAARLNDVARNNISSDKRPARLREASGPAPKTSSRPILPVATDRLDAANAEADAILQGAETLLLRASVTSERRKVAFSQIATAVGSSTTVLLRSA